MYERDTFRKLLAERLTDYMIGEQTCKELWNSRDIRDPVFFNDTINGFTIKINAVKCFARQIGIITYEECFDITTQELIDKIKAEAE